MCFWSWTNCAYRNQGLLQGELLFALDPTTSEKQQLVYKLSLGEHHIVTGTCTSKKEGQQLGAQAMLKVSITYLFRQRVQVWLCHLWISLMAHSICHPNSSSDISCVTSSHHFLYRNCIHTSQTGVHCWGFTLKVLLEERCSASSAHCAHVQIILGT